MVCKKCKKNKLQSNFIGKREICGRCHWRAERSKKADFRKRTCDACKKTKLVRITFKIKDNICDACVREMERRALYAKNKKAKLEAKQYQFYVKQKLKPYKKRCMQGLPLEGVVWYKRQPYFKHQRYNEGT